MELILSTIGISSIIGIVLLTIGKIIPNEKVYGFGFSLGVWLDSFGTLKMGSSWNKIESFILNSGGQFFKGFKDGLTGEPEQPETPQIERRVRR